MPRVLKTRLLTQSDIERLMDMRTAIRVIERTFIAQTRGEAVMPPKIYLPLPHQSDFRAMPAYLAHPACCGVKWVNVHPHNQGTTLPTVMGLVILNDPRTGFPLAILDGLSITRLRTGAAAGVAAKALARRNSRIVGLVGCGAQAFHQLVALVDQFRLSEVRVWGYRPGEAQQFCRRTRRHLAVVLMPVRTVKACVTDADLIVTITSSRRPLVMREWVRPGAHINALGADAPGKQELDPAILRAAKVIVDDPTQAIHGGEINVPIARRLFKPQDIHATLGEVLIGNATGRTKPTDVTVFDSTGVAVHDIALGEALLRQALRRRIGRTIRWFHG